VLETGPPTTNAGPGQKTVSTVKVREEWIEAPDELTSPGPAEDDPWKGVFGGKAIDKGLRLGASFPGPKTGDWTEVRLFVLAEDGTDMADVSAVEFFIHDDFEPNRLKTPVLGDKAKLSVNVTGGFTVGAWVPARRAKLELDLSKAPGAPRIVREL
jgi:hypothetical protein